MDMQPSEEAHHLTEASADYASAALRRAVRIGVKFKNRSDVIRHKSYLDLYRTIAEDLPLVGMPLDALMDEVEQSIVDHSTNFSSPMAMAFPDAGNAIAALVGSVIADLINQNLINWLPCSPTGTVVDVLVVEWFRKLVGFAVSEYPHKEPVHAGGLISSGGVASNTIATLLARERMQPGCMKTGYVGSIPTIVVPDGIDHYSSRLSAGWLGMGEHAVVRSPTTGFRYDLAKLHERLEELTASKRRPMMLVAYAGDSRTMTCDDFGALRAMCDDHGIWLHVDACHGTQLLFHGEARSRLAGLSQADSITLDPHKVLTIPYAMSVLLVRDPRSLHAVARPEDIITGEAHSFGQITPFFGSRPFSSLKLYMMIKHLGLAGIEDMIDRRIAMARHLASMVEQSDEFLLVNPEVEINSVAFMYWPYRLRASTKQAAENRAAMNDLNEQLQKRLLRSGRVWLHNFLIPDSDNVLGLGAETILRPLRYMSGNPATTIDHVTQMIREVLAQGRTLLAEVSANEPTGAHPYRPSETFPVPVADSSHHAPGRIRSAAHSLIGE